MFGSQKFIAWKILKGLDLDDHAGNFGTVEILRGVEGLEGYQRGIFPGRSTISNRANELEKHADSIVPYKCYESETGHRNIRFKYENVLRHALTSLSLSEKAETTSVTICFTVDYAEVCKTSKRGHVLGGIKIVDIDAKYPGTNKNMFDLSEEGKEGCGGFHSAELLTCIPLHFVVGKESNEVFSKDMRNFFEFAERVRNDGLIARHQGEKTLKRFNVVYPMDMSAEQKCFSLGGGCKIKEFFCIKCAARSSDLMFHWEVGSKFSCGADWCINGLCRHRAVDDDDELDKKKEQMKELLNIENTDDLHTTLHIEEQVKDTTVMRFDPGVLNREKDIHHIDYDYRLGRSQDRVSFFQSIKYEFELRKWKFTGNPFLCVQKLKQSMMDGRMVTVLRDSIQHVEEKRGTFLFPMELAVPCILHMENRISEKVSVMVILEGLRHRQSGVNTVCYFSQLNNLLNNGILSEKNGNFKFPTVKDELKQLSLSNTTARKLISNIDKLFDTVFLYHNDSGERRAEFQKCVDIYPKIMDKLRQKIDFTHTEVVELQKMIDDWYNTWINITGREGMTNYIHMLGAGHVTYYIIKHGSLYKYSNQSWERLNKRVKRMYLQKTQRGGHGKYVGKNDTVSYRCPHTVPIARWLQRIIMWNCGEGDKLFK